MNETSFFLVKKEEIKKNSQLWVSKNTAVPPPQARLGEPAKTAVKR